MMQNVAVFFGGKSAEREISVLTGVLALRMIDPAKYRAVPVYIHSDGDFYTAPEAFSLDVFKAQPFPLHKFSRCYFQRGELLIVPPKKHRVKARVQISVAINCCHGGAGENGGVSALCELYGIPSASPSVAACAVAMDKELTKFFMYAAGVPVLPCAAVHRKSYVRRGEAALAEAKSLGFPLIVKPACSGSSIGIAVIREEAALKNAAEEAFRYGEKLIFEPYLESKSDVNCAAYLKKGEIVVSEPETAFSGGVYGFKEKYMQEKQNGGGSGALNAEIAEKIKAYTREIYSRFETSGVIRADFLVSDRGIFLGEINAVPGSLAYYLFCDRLIDGRRFLSDLLSEPFFGNKREIELPETGVLQSVSAGGKRGFAGVRL